MIIGETLMKHPFQKENPFYLPKSMFALDSFESLFKKISIENRNMDEIIRDFLKRANRSILYNPTRLAREFLSLFVYTIKNNDYNRKLFDYSQLDNAVLVSDLNDMKKATRCSLIIGETATIIEKGNRKNFFIGEDLDPWA